MSAHRGEKTIIIIDSANRLTGTPNNFTYKITLPVNHRYDHCCILQASIPKSWHTLPENYRTFQLVELGVYVSISLPKGNYNRTSFKSILVASLNANSPNNWTYDMSFPNETLTVDSGRFSFTVADNGGNQPSFVMPSDTYVSNIFGFEPESTNTFFGDNLESTRSINFQSHNSILIKSDLVQSNGSVLQEILSSNSPYQGVVSFQTADVQFNSKLITGRQNNVYNFSLSTSSGESLDLNGQNWSFSLLFYQDDNISELQRKRYELQLLNEESAHNAEYLDGVRRQDVKGRRPAQEPAQ